MKRLLSVRLTTKRNRQGRATFLPLTTIKPRQLNGQFAQSLANAPGLLVASDLVTLMRIAYLTFSKTS